MILVLRLTNDFRAREQSENVYESPIMFMISAKTSVIQSPYLVELL